MSTIGSPPTPSAPAFVAVNTRTAASWVIAWLHLPVALQSLVPWLLLPFIVPSLFATEAYRMLIFEPESQVRAGTFAVMLVWLIGIALAFADARTLAVRGLPQPFPAAYSLLGTGVYIIGRSVVARRRTGDKKAFAPAMAWIVISAVLAFGMVLQVIYIIILFAWGFYAMAVGGR